MRPDFTWLHAKYAFTERLEVEALANLYADALHPLDQLDEEPAHGRQGVFDHWRDNRIDLPIDQPVPFHLA